MKAGLDLGLVIGLVQDLYARCLEMGLSRLSICSATSKLERLTNEHADTKSCH